MHAMTVDLYSGVQNKIEKTWNEEEDGAIEIQIGVCVCVVCDAVRI